MIHFSWCFFHVSSQFAQQFLYFAIPLYFTDEMIDKKVFFFLLEHRTRMTMKYSHLCLTPGYFPKQFYFDCFFIISGKNINHECHFNLVQSLQNKLAFLLHIICFFHGYFVFILEKKLGNFFF